MFETSTRLEAVGLGGFCRMLCAHAIPHLFMEGGGVKDVAADSNKSICYRTEFFWSSYIDTAFDFVTDNIVNQEKKNILCKSWRQN